MGSIDPRMSDLIAYAYNNEVIGVSDEEYQVLKDKGHVGTDYVPLEP